VKTCCHSASSSSRVRVEFAPSHSGTTHLGRQPDGVDADRTAIARRARKLLRAGRLTHCQAVLLDTLLWCCRPHGQAAACASYSVLQRMAHLARATIADGLRMLEQLGLIRRVKRRVLVLWHNGGRAWRQLPSEYRSVQAADCEFSQQTDSKTRDITICARMDGDAERAAAALAAVRDRRRYVVEATLLRKEVGAQ
jgi:hypothetical protein